jgi:hypothetical protein
MVAAYCDCACYSRNLIEHVEAPIFFLLIHTMATFYALSNEISLLITSSVLFSLKSLNSMFGWTEIGTQKTFSFLDDIHPNIIFNAVILKVGFQLLTVSILNHLAGTFPHLEDLKITLSAQNLQHLNLRDWNNISKLEILLFEDIIQSYEDLCLILSISISSLQEMCCGSEKNDGINKIIIGM